MERCPEHDLINCKCREPLATFLVKQFAESVSDRVARTGAWHSGDHPSGDDRGGAGADRRGLGDGTGGDR